MMMMMVTTNTLGALFFTCITYLILTAILGVKYVNSQLIK